MKTLAVILFLTSFCLAQKEPARVRFANGDVLSGSILSMNQEAISWHSDVLRDPSEFALNNLLDITMPDQKSDLTRTQRVEHEAILEMMNGDTIKGQLSGVGLSEIRLATSFAGELTLKRVNVREVRIESVADFFYRGPSSMEEWTRSGSGNAWRYETGSLYSSAGGGIAKEVDFTDECVIGFDASWPNSLRATICFFTNDIKATSPKQGYEMVFQGSSIHMRKFGVNGVLGHTAAAGALRENRKARIEIKASVKTGKFAVFVNGEMIEVFTDVDVDRKKLGKGFHLVSHDGSPLRVSQIQIFGWDGYLEAFENKAQRAFDFDEEEEPEEERPEADIQEGRMMLLNGDSIEGEVMKIENEEITIKTKFSEVSFPLARLKNFHLPAAELETPRLYKGDVRATMRDGSQLVFRLDAVEGDALLGFSQNFGSARLQRNEFQKIEFNIYRKELDSFRAQEDW
jgi:hypothetical protein